MHANTANFKTLDTVMRQLNVLNLAFSCIQECRSLLDVVVRWILTWNFELYSGGEDRDLKIDKHCVKVAFFFLFERARASHLLVQCARVEKAPPGKTHSTHAGRWVGHVSKCRSMSHARRNQLTY